MATRKKKDSSIRFDKATQTFTVTCKGKTNRYGIGSRVNKGDCAYVPERGEWKATTLEDARQMAEDFAANISRIVG